MNRPEEDVLAEKLSELSSTADPSAELEDRVISALYARGLLTATAKRSPAGRLAFRLRQARVALAASLVAALGGWLAHGFWSQGVRPPTPPPAVFLLLLSEPEGLQTERPHQDLVAEYREWALALDSRDQLVDAGQLLPEGVRHNGLYLNEGLQIEAEELRGATGYFVIRARDIAEASEIARSCPHLRYGGVIDVRPIASSASR